MRIFNIVKGFEEQDVKLPARGSALSAGYDFHTIKEMTLPPSSVTMVQTGVKAYMPDNEVLLIYVRSSTAIKKGLTLKNQTAVIDADYAFADNDGHIVLAIENNSNQEYTLEKHERIAQGVFVQYGITDDDKAKGKRTGGIGSTDKGDNIG